MRTYMMFMVCVLVTLGVLFITGIMIGLAWDCLIEPIMDRIRHQKDEYWKNRYREARDEYDNCLRKLGGLLPSTIEAIIPDTVETMVSHDGCEDFQERVMITFTVDTTDLYKRWERRAEHSEGLSDRKEDL